MSDLLWATLFTIINIIVAVVVDGASLVVVSYDVSLKHLG